MTSHTKTKYVLFRTRHRKIPCNHPNVCIGGHAMSMVDNIRFLGVVLNEYLSWRPYISAISLKISKSLGVLRRLKHTLPQTVLKILYNSIIMPHLNYCNIIWGHTYKSQLRKIEILQKKDSQSYN